MQCRITLGMRNEAANVRVAFLKSGPSNNTIESTTGFTASGVCLSCAP